MALTLQEIWIYPVKACRGVSVPRAELTSTGLEFDRAWCIVDCTGVSVAKMEAISQRKMPGLATVSVSFSADKSSLLLDAPGMPQLAIPAASRAYLEQETVHIECSGKSTTTGGGWSLGFEEAKVHPDASSWISNYLNREVGPGGKRISGQRVSLRYAVVRSMAALEMQSYPPIFPLIARASEDPRYKERFAGNAKRFADFAPLLLVNQASARFVGERGGGQGAYPLAPFRGNLVVDSGANAWAEESWARIEVLAPAGEPGQQPREAVALRKIKECPRCTVPCRDQLTGGWLFPADSLRLWRVLRRAFPRKNRDPEWGTWAGPFFGVYFGNAGHVGTLCVGDTLRVTETCHWDDHLRWRVPPDWAFGFGVAAALVAVAGVTWARARAR